MRLSYTCVLTRSIASVIAIVVCSCQRSAISPGSMGCPRLEFDLGPTSRSAYLMRMAALYVVHEQCQLADESLSDLAGRVWRLPDCLECDGQPRGGVMPVFRITAVAFRGELGPARKTVITNATRSASEWCDLCRWLKDEVRTQKDAPGAPETMSFWCEEIGISRPVRVRLEVEVTGGWGTQAMIEVRCMTVRRADDGPTGDVSL